VIKFGKKDKKNPNETVDVWSNFKDYDLPPPIGLLRMDLHKHSFTNKKHVEGFLQGVVGDPPYGVRAGGRKSGGRKRKEDGSAFEVPEKFKSDHIPSTIPYPFSECMDDLLENSARLLAIGGRLAFFMPCAADAEDAKTAGADETPRHPMLRLVAKSDQMLSSRWGRRLVTFEKVKPYDEAEAREARVALREERRKNGGMEDLLQRMREVVYHGERAAERKKREKAKHEKTLARGAAIRDPRETNASA
jgi:tRNA (guanine10-N2)-methyltransferase